ncbi:hypothetical protein DVH24_039096 [Malus domestica]|uniref:Uncharacterized protein n=1 Tax=Malus domestica TaxID=3750 RepID=A0A498KGY7_MALDO|nr:hypothetical protein DVH24_039096 [Malus domestica]
MQDGSIAVVKKLEELQQEKLKLHKQLLSLGYYQPTMKEDMDNMVKRCYACQDQAPPLYTVLTLWKRSSQSHKQDTAKNPKQDGTQLR